MSSYRKTEEYRAIDRERQRRYRAANKEKIRKRRRAKYLNTRAAVLAKARERYRKNPAIFKARRDAWRRKNPEKFSQQFCRWNSRRAMRVGAKCGDRHKIAEVYRRARTDRNVFCYLCDKRIKLGDRHVDHVVSLDSGGEHDASNLAIACSLCNLKKHKKPLSSLGWLPFTA